MNEFVTVSESKTATAHEIFNRNRMIDWTNIKKIDAHIHLMPSDVIEANKEYGGNFIDFGDVEDYLKIMDKYNIESAFIMPFNDPYISSMINKVVQGWINYYTHYYKSEFYEVLRYINQCLIKWVRRSYKKKNTRSRAEHWLGAIARRDRNLFAHWKFGILPSVGEGAV